MEEKMMEEKEKFCVCWFKEGRVFTLEEEQILSEIREIKKEYDKLKKRLSSLTEESSIEEVKLQIANLRERRNYLERLRQKAAAERMKLLGHSK